MRKFSMKEKDIVRFKAPQNSDEKDAKMIVLEMRGNRVLVSDLRFSKWIIPPFEVVLADELEVAYNGEKLTIQTK